MATYYHGIDIPLAASGDLNGKQFYWVQPAATARLVEGGTGASGPAPIGVLQNDPASGETANVRVMGSTKLVSSNASGNIGYRDFLTCGSDGQAVLAGTAGTGSHVGAIALEANSSGSGVTIEAFIFPNFLSGSGNYTDNTP